VSKRYTPFEVISGGFQNSCKMGKKTGVFTEGQHVFAKVKGYSPWPAKVSYPRKKRVKDPENRKITSGAF
jgi:PWWP domain